MSQKILACAGIVLMSILLLSACKNKNKKQQSQIDEARLLENFSKFVAIPPMSAILYAQEIDLQNDGFKEIYAVIKSLQPPKKCYTVLFNAKTYTYMGGLELPPYQTVDEVDTLIVSRITGDKIDDMTLLFKEKRDTSVTIWNSTSTFAQGKMRFLYDYEVFEDGPTRKKISHAVINEKSELIIYNERLDKRDSCVYATYDVRDYIETGWVKPKTHFFLTKCFAYPRVKDRNAVWNSNYILMSQIYGGMERKGAMEFYKNPENTNKINQLKAKYNF
ncbi:MAG: hypothetical protein NZ455_14730 [Bacteroidia bacterium]|nr:hypothetical protein [Bacteroidia bacterium]MDW8345464.1 hypothetical protein [Bacteroidia bacterium]